MRHFGSIGLIACICAMMHVSTARATFIPYPTPGVENPITYSFTAASTGTVSAYFVAGAAAGFTNELGMSVNGGPVAVFGLNNHTSAYGDVLNLGSVNAGDSLVFVMHNITPGIGDVYSDPSLNAAYDHEATGHNHIYATAFLTDGIIPNGTFVAFEDLPPVNPYFTEDWNYNDEDFVFTNVAATPSVPVPAAVWGGIMLMGGMAGWRKLRRRPA
jgi:hypothetical protein